MKKMLRNPSFGHALGTDRSMGQPYVKADRAQKQAANPRVLKAGIAKQDTKHGTLDLPVANLNKHAGLKAGGIVFPKSKDKAVSKKAMNMAPFARGGGIERKGKTEGTMVKMAGGGKVAMEKKELDFFKKKGAPASIIKHEKAEIKEESAKKFARGGGIEQRGKTRGKMC